MPVGEVKRLEWIDAMRGLTMILVVAYHVMNRCFVIADNDSASLPFLVLFRMPLFFFISGFLAYKATATWSFPEFKNMLGKKIRVQIIPTVVFFFIAATLLQTRGVWFQVIIMFHSPTKQGYWFTLVLLYMFIIYYLFTFIEYRFKKKSFVPLCVLWLIAIATYVTVYMPHQFWYGIGNGKLRTGWLFDSSIIQLMLFFQYFIYGNIVRRYWHNFEKLYEKKGFFLCIVIIAFLSTTEYLKLHLLPGQWSVISRTISVYSLITIIFLFFRYYQNSFSKETNLGRKLQYIGTRTLDIYLIHFLFIPFVPEVGKYFVSHPNFVLEVVASIFVAMIVIMFCIVTSNIIRISPFLKKYLFGREDKIIH